MVFGPQVCPNGLSHFELDEALLADGSFEL